MLTTSTRNPAFCMAGSKASPPCPGSPRSRINDIRPPFGQHGLRGIAIRGFAHIGADHRRQHLVQPGAHHGMVVHYQDFHPSTGCGSGRRTVSVHPLLRVTATDPPSAVARARMPGKPSPVPSGPPPPSS